MCTLVATSVIVRSLECITSYLLNWYLKTNPLPPKLKSFHSHLSFNQINNFKPSLESGVFCNLSHQHTPFSWRNPGEQPRLLSDPCLGILAMVKSLFPKGPQCAQKHVVELHTLDFFSVSSIFVGSDYASTSLFQEQIS